MQAVVFEADSTLFGVSNAHHIAGMAKGVDELLPILKRLGIKVAVLATDETAARLEAGPVRSFVQTVVISNSRSIDPKKRGLTQALDELNVAPEQAMMVSNRVLDIMTGKEGRMAKTVGVASGDGNPGALEAAGADHIINDIPSLLDVLE